MSQEQPTGGEGKAPPDLPYRVPVDVIVWIFLILCAGGLGLAVVSVAQDPKGTPWYAWPLLGLGLLALLKTLGRPSGLCADEEGIQHQNVLLKTRRIAWHEIDRVQTGTQDANIKGIAVKGTLGRVDPSMGPYLMVFHRKGSEKPFLLNIKPYTVKGLANLVRILSRKNPQVQLDEATIQLEKGIAPSLFFPK